MTTEPDATAKPPVDRESWLNFTEAVRRDEQWAWSILDDFADDSAKANGVPAEVAEEETTPLRDAFRSVLPAPGSKMGRQQTLNAIADMLLEGEPWTSLNKPDP
jgi:hypothetical protein